MPSLVHEDIRSVFAGGGATASGSPFAAIKKTAVNTDALLEEQLKANHRIVRLLSDMKDTLEDIKGGGNGGLSLTDLIVGKMLFGRLRGALAAGRSVGQVVRAFGAGVVGFAASVVRTAFDKTMNVVRAVGAPISRMVQAVGKTQIAGIVARVTRTLSLTTGVVSTLSGWFKGIAVLGGNIAKIPGIGSLPGLLKGGAGLLAKIAWPITALFGVFDAISGWNNADEILGEKADLKGRIVSSLGSILSGLTFGLTDKLAGMFGWPNLSQAMNTGLNAMGSFFRDTLWGSIRGGIQTAWNFVTGSIDSVLGRLPSVNDIITSMPDIPGMVRNLLTAPATLMKDMMNYVGANFPDIGVLAADLGNRIWDSITWIFNQIGESVKTGVSAAWTAMSGGQHTNTNLPVNERVSAAGAAFGAAVNPNSGTVTPSSVLAAAAPMPSSSPADIPLAPFNAADMAATPLKLVIDGAGSYTAPSTDTSVPWVMGKEGGMYWVQEIATAIRTALNPHGDSNPLVTPGVGQNGGVGGVANQIGPAANTNLPEGGLDAMGLPVTAVPGLDAYRLNMERAAAAAVAGGAVPVGGMTTAGVAGYTPANSNGTVPAGATHRTIPGGSTAVTTGYVPGRTDSGALLDPRGRVISTADTSLPAEQRAFLDTLAMGNATSGGNYWESPDYNTIVGGKSFTDFSKHPNITGVVTAYGPSTAAGRYQFTNRTWNNTLPQYNAAHPDAPITDFSPQSQDKMALFLAQQDYKRRTHGGDLMADLASGRADLGSLISSGLGGSGSDTTWQILQKKSPAEIQSAFDANLARNRTYEAAKAANNNPIPPGLLSELSYANEGATRNDPLTDKLYSDIQKGITSVYGAGYRGEIYSGGQESNKPGEGVGSTRHNHGGAGDVYVYGPDGKRLTGDQLAPIAQHWLASNLGGVGLEMNGGGIHLDNHTDRARTWNYLKNGGQFTAGQRAAVEAGLNGVSPQYAMHPDMLESRIALAQNAKVQQSIIERNQSTKSLAAQPYSSPYAKQLPGPTTGFDPNTGVFMADGIPVSASIPAMNGKQVTSGMPANATGPRLQVVSDSPAVSSPPKAPPVTPPPPPVNPPTNTRREEDYVERTKVTLDSVSTRDETDVLLYNTGLFG